MTIAYPLGWPAGIVPNDMTMRPRVLVAGVEMEFTGAVQTVKWQGAWFEFEATFPPLEEDDHERMAAFKLSLHGRHGTFLVGDLSKKRRGTPTGMPVVRGAGIVGSTLPTRGWVPGSTGNLRQGDYVQLGAGLLARLHRVLSLSVDADGAGEADCDVFPPVHGGQALTDGQAVTVDSPVGLFRLASNEMAWRAQLARQYGHVLAARSVP